MARRVNLTVSIDQPLAADIDLFRPKGLKVSEVCRAALRAEIDRLKTEEELAAHQYNNGVQVVNAVPDQVVTTQSDPAVVVNFEDILAKFSPDDLARYEALPADYRARIDQAGRAGTIDAWRVRRASLTNFE